MTRTVPVTEIPLHCYAFQRRFSRRLRGLTAQQSSRLWRLGPCRSGAGSWRLPEVAHLQYG
jgi:hypothetical protein